MPAKQETIQTASLQSPAEKLAGRVRAFANRMVETIGRPETFRLRVWKARAVSVDTPAARVAERSERL